MLGKGLIGFGEGEVDWKVGWNEEKRFRWFSLANIDFNPFLKLKSPLNKKLKNRFFGSFGNNGSINEVFMVKSTSEPVTLPIKKWNKVAFSQTYSKTKKSKVTKYPFSKNHHTLPFPAAFPKIKTFYHNIDFEFRRKSSIIKVGSRNHKMMLP